MKTAKEALEAWDRGESVWTIEMGGLGPGYEQTIQVLVFEIIRECEGVLPDYPADTDDEARKKYPPALFALRDAAVSRTNRSAGGYSGAQVGVATQIAAKALHDGWNKMVESVPRERKIQVSRAWPNVPVSKESPDDN